MLLRALFAQVLSLNLKIIERLSVARKQAQHEDLGVVDKLRLRAGEKLPNQIAHTERYARALIAWIVLRLRKYPWWWAGHLRLAQLSLEGGDIVLAYGSALAALKLAQGNVQEFSANLVLGQVLLANNDAARATPYLSKAIELDPTSAQAVESLSGALIAQGRNQEAEELLSRLATKERSAGANITLEWLKDKRKN